MKKKTVVIPFIAFLLLLINLILVYSFVYFGIINSDLPIFPKTIIEKIQIVSDKDKDGITDLDDIVVGARLQVIKSPRYFSKYYQGGYPPDNEGVCTDVVWRAYKNAGYNLKKLIDDDIRKNIQLYPAVKGKPDPNIDFRRVKNLLVFLQRNAQSLTTDFRSFDKENLKEWQGGDIVIINNGSHIAIVSDKRRFDGIPYIIHSPSVHPYEEDTLRKWKDKIVGHFRYIPKS